MITVEIEHPEAVIQALEVALDDGDMFLDEDEERDLMLRESIEEIIEQIRTKLIIAEKRS